MYQFPGHRLWQCSPEVTEADCADAATDQAGVDGHIASAWRAFDTHIKTEPGRLGEDGIKDRPWCVFVLGSTVQRMKLH